MPWYDSAWTYRQKITIAAAQVDADLDGFPVMINQAVVQASLFTRAKTDGSDFVVTAGDGTTKLKRELVHYDSGGGLELYVRVATLLAASDTELYLYYGNAAAAEANDADTWDNGFGLVLHMQEDPQVDTPPVREHGQRQRRRRRPRQPCERHERSLGRQSRRVLRRRPA